MKNFIAQTHFCLPPSSMRKRTTFSAPVRAPFLRIYGLWGLTLVQTMGMFPIAFLTMSGDFRVLSVESYLEVTGMNRLGRGAALLFVRKKFPLKRLLEGLMMTPFALPWTLMRISYILAFNSGSRACSRLCS